MDEQLREIVLDSLSSTVEQMQGVLTNKLTIGDNSLEAMMMALKEETKSTMRALSTRIEELD
ncbi:hypothetical protein J1N35_014875 [Gossypium stocksii]|uniref:Uncharacterized protein n=1 Tax=Gossypium stocksii TaxID=47602 RepID=A0A9D4A9T1_9ROSI|nr:hypothetical protein J1N35_014875 [Gossypium stocksii]